MASVQELRDQAAALLAKAQEQEEAERVKVFETVLDRLNKAGLSVDAFVAWSKPKRAKAKEGGSVAAKYKGPNGELWAGRGRSPAWITAHEAVGKNRDDFLIK